MWALHTKKETDMKPNYEHVDPKVRHKPPSPCVTDRSLAMKNTLGRIFYDGFSPYEQAPKEVQIAFYKLILGD